MQGRRTQAPGAAKTSWKGWAPESAEAHRQVAAKLAREKDEEKEGWDSDSSESKEVWIKSYHDEEDEDDGGWEQRGAYTMPRSPEREDLQVLAE